MIFFDTNVLVYLFDTGAGIKRSRAKELFERHGPSGEAIISTQVLQEFYVVVTRKLSQPLSEEMAFNVLREFSALPVVQVDTELVLAAVRRSIDGRLSYWDGLIVEAALRGGAETLLSEDLQHGLMIESLRVVNPFARERGPHPTRKRERGKSSFLRMSERFMPRHDSGTARR